ncbi:MAG: hypothetical protein HON90_10140, partial [Halobacteriovoraceae bacterium]|nr:hypothetical protein [Halobacteriovoraceae bacterium]
MKLVCVFIFVFISHAIFPSDNVCLSQMLEQLLKEQLPAIRSHPDLLGIKNIKVGKTAYLPSKGFDPRSKLSLKTNDVTQVTITKIEFKEGFGKVVFVSSPEIGTSPIPISRFVQNAYSRKDFAQRSPFTQDEFVEIAPTSANYTNTTYPPIGQFQGVFDEDQYIVSTRLSKPGSTQLNTLINKNDIKGFSGSTPEKLQQSLKPFLDIKLFFVAGERIRFRDKNGFLQSGLFYNSNNNIAKINVAGKIQEVNINEIFKNSNTHPPKTPSYKADWILVKDESPTGSYRDLLNAGAKITSTTEFHLMHDQERFETLIKFIKAKIPWTAAANFGEENGLNTYNKLICTGVGVCRHNSLVLASILSEAGYRVRPTAYFPGANREGHAWLEVDSVQADGKIITYILDPSTPDILFSKPLENAQ